MQDLGFRLSRTRLLGYSVHSWYWSMLLRFVEVSAGHRRWFPGARAWTLMCLGSPKSKSSRATHRSTVVLAPSLY